MSHHVSSRVVTVRELLERSSVVSGRSESTEKRVGA
jgi:hypothetical protein